MSNLRHGALVLLGLLFVSACSSSVEYTREPQIRYADARDRYEDISLHKIFHDGKLMGYADSKRLKDGDSNDYNDRHEIFILDANHDMVGYITDHNQAFRLRAHGPSELVAVNDDLGRNVQAIFGWRQGTVTLKRMVYQED